MNKSPSIRVDLPAYACMSDDIQRCVDVGWIRTAGLEIRNGELSSQVLELFTYYNQRAVSS